MATLKIYKTYSFTDKDPVIDELRTMMQDARMSYFDIADASGLSATTVRRWFEGSTRRPQSASVEAAGRAMGWKRGWVPLDTKALSSKDRRVLAGSTKRR